MRSYPVKYGFYLNEFDPYFDYRATKYIVDHGLDAYWKWQDMMSWYPEGRDVPKTSQSGLHIVSAYLFEIFGGGSSLLDFTILLPVVLGSLTTIVIFALVRTLGGTYCRYVLGIIVRLYASHHSEREPWLVQVGTAGLILWLARNLPVDICNQAYVIKICDSKSSPGRLASRTRKRFLGRCSVFQYTNLIIFHRPSVLPKKY